MLKFLFALLLFTAAATAAPVFEERAGAPSRKHLPATCVLQNPINITTAYQPSGLTYAVSPDFKKNHLAYSYYLYDDTAQIMSLSELFQQCMETCNGLMECKAGFMAYRVWRPEWMGIKPGVEKFGCFLFNKPIGEQDFVHAPAGLNLNATVGNFGPGCRVRPA